MTSRIPYLVHILGGNLGGFATENQVAPLWAEADGNLASEQYKRIYITILRINSSNWLHPRGKQTFAHLFAARKEKVDGVIAVGNGRAEPGQPMEHERW
jgi:hypothetical protein